MTEPREVHPYRTDKDRVAKDFSLRSVRGDEVQPSPLEMAGAAPSNSVRTATPEPTREELAVIAAEEDPEILKDELLKEL